MRAKQAFLGVVTPLGFGLLCVLFLGNGCSKSNSTSSGSSGGGTQSAASPVSLPEFYGIYAVDGGKPVAIHQAADQEFSPNVQLIINAKSIGTGKKQYPHHAIQRWVHDGSGHDARQTC